VIEIELAVLTVTIIVSSVLWWRSSNALIGRLYDRQKVLDHRERAVATEELRALRLAAESVERTNVIHEDARLLHARVDLKLADLKRVEETLNLNRFGG
jgi:nitric oxide synthase oxygenase domain/subunit